MGKKYQPANEYEAYLILRGWNKKQGDYYWTHPVNPPEGLMNALATQTIIDIENIGADSLAQMMEGNE